MELYRLAVENPSWTPEQARDLLGLDEARISELVSLLVEHRLLRPSQDSQYHYHASGPESAAVELLEADRRRLQDEQFRMDRVRDEILSLQATYFSARQARRSSEAFDVVEDVDLIRLLLSNEAQRAEEELCVAHPGGGMSEGGLTRSISLDSIMLERGVVMRSVLQHATRHHAPTRHYVNEVTKLGAQVRTIPVVPRRMIIFDRKVAFIPVEGGEVAQGAVMLREPSVVDNLYSFFDLMWQSGRPFPVDVSNEQTEAKEEVREAILEALATGAKDEMVSRKLGISVRSCRRHIAEIMTELKAESRFQAGIFAHKRGLVN
ncbi:LuxR C-terminal-related transcriptional regulator [Nocardiopsis terrae]